MKIDVHAAASFMAMHGRVLDRRRLQLLVGEANPGDVLAALDAYRNPDGGYAWGLEPDLRTWHRHITFARCRDVAPHTLRPFLKEHADFDAGMIRVESFVLYSSVPGPLGSAYTRELEVKAL